MNMTPETPKPPASPKAKALPKIKAIHGTDWGAPSDLPASTLPTYTNIAQLYMKLSAGVNVRTLPAEVKRIVNEIVDQVINKWKDANPRIPLFEHNTIFQKVKRLIDVIKRFNSKKYKKNELKWTEKVKDKLFDISRCNCELPLLECKDQRICCKKDACDLKHYYCACDLPSDLKVSKKVLMP